MALCVRVLAMLLYFLVVCGGCGSAFGSGLIIPLAWSQRRLGVSRLSLSFNTSAAADPAAVTLPHVTISTTDARVLVPWQPMILSGVLPGDVEATLCVPAAPAGRPHSSNSSHPFLRGDCSPAARPVLADSNTLYPRRVWSESQCEGALPILTTIPGTASYLRFAPEVHTFGQLSSVINMHDAPLIAHWAHNASSVGWLGLGSAALRAAFRAELREQQRAQGGNASDATRSGVDVLLNIQVAPDCDAAATQHPADAARCRTFDVGTTQPLLSGAIAAINTSRVTVHTRVPEVHAPLVAWSEPCMPPDISERLLFPVYDVSVCGARLSADSNRMWLAEVDTAATCLTLPPTLFDALMAWVPHAECVGPENDTALHHCQVPADALAAWAEGGVGLPWLYFSLSPNGTAPIALPLSALLVPATLLRATAAANATAWCIMRDSRVLDVSEAKSPSRTLLAHPIRLGSYILATLFATIDAQARRVGLAPTLHAARSWLSLPRGVNASAGGDGTNADTATHWQHHVAHTRTPTGPYAQCAPLATCPHGSVFVASNNSCRAPACGSYMMLSNTLASDAQCVPSALCIVAATAAVCLCAAWEVWLHRVRALKVDALQAAGRRASA